MPASSETPPLSTDPSLLPADPGGPDASGRVPLTVTTGIAIFGIGGVGFMTANLVPLMMIALSDGLGLSTTEAGTVMTASMLLTAVTSLLATRLASGKRRRPIARIGLVLSFLGFGAAAVIPVVPVAVTGIILGGLGAGGGIAAGGAALAALRNPNRVSGISGVSNRILVTIVLFLVPLFGIVMQSAFGILALLALAALFTTHWIPTATVKPPVDSAGGWQKIQPTKPSRQETLAGFALLVSIALWAVSEDSLWAMIGPMGAAHSGFREQDLGLVLSACTIGGLVMAIVLTVIGSRGGRALPLGIMLAVGGSLKIWASFTTDPGLYAGLIITWNTIYAMAMMYMIATAAALNASGRWSGPLFGTYLIGSSFSPVTGAFLAEQFGFHAMGIILGCMSFALLIPFAVIARFSSRLEKGHAGHALAAEDASVNAASA